VDYLGRTTSCQSNVQIIDGGISTLSCGFVYVDLKEGESQAVDLSNLYSASDLCGLASVIPAQTSITVDCDYYGQTLQIPVIATDVNGNQATCNMRVIVRSPYWANCNQITVELNQNGQAYVPASDVANYGSVCSQARDGYDQTLVQQLRLAVAPYPDIDIDGGITYGPEDAGKSFTYLYEITAPSFQKCFANVSVIESQGPTAVCQDITVALDEDSQVTITPQQVDGGSTSPVDLTLSLDVSSFSCTDLGANTVTLTASSNDRTSTCEATVTVVDDTAPTAICKTSLVASLDANGQATVQAIDLDNGSTDNCGSGALTFAYDVGTTQLHFDCSDVNTSSYRTLTVVDAAGNVSTCFSQVYVKDEMAPVARCKDVTIELDASGKATYATDIINDGSSDNCGSVSVQTQTVIVTCANIGFFESILGIFAQPPKNLH
jgi:hypothetical protein